MKNWILPALLICTASMAQEGMTKRVSSEPVQKERPKKADLVAPNEQGLQYKQGMNPQRRAERAKTTLATDTLKQPTGMARRTRTN